MKYNKSKIMKRAWELKRTFRSKYTFGQCLYRAWREAKEEAAENAYSM